MAYNITYDEKMAQYIVDTGKETKLVVRPHEKRSSWIGVEYIDQYDSLLSESDYTPLSQDTLNEVVNGIDIAIRIETKDLPSMLRELANLMEGKNVNRK